MAEVLIVYYSRSGHTKKMAELIGQGMTGAGVTCEIKDVKDVSSDQLLKPAAIILGSPTYYGLPSFEVKKLLDESVQYHGKLAGKIGGAFTSAANIGGGNETTILAILQAWLVHGMIVPGMALGDHYGPVSIGAPDARVEKQAVVYGQKIAELVKKLGR